ncbi:unnamed protein product [Malus baccata var. baccata]
MGRNPFATVVFVPLILDASSFQAFEEWTALRLTILKNNFEFVEKFNKNGKGFTVGLNHFADLTTEKITDGYYCRRVQYSDSATSMTISDNAVAVENIDNSTCSSIDWVEYGVVTPFRMLMAACCWAFAVVTGIEGIYGTQMGKDKMVPLSPQQLVDCDEFSNGCKGGLEDYAYDYPYKSNRGECNQGILESLPVVTRINSYQPVLPRDEEALARAACQQPVTVGIDPGSSAFVLYKGGIFTDECVTNLTQIVTIVSIGRDEPGTEYWRIKNSWGKE